MQELTVEKRASYIEVPVELLLDLGAITEDEARARGWTAPPPVPRLVRLRWRWQAARERWGRRVGSWIAGVDLTEDDE